VAGTVSPNTEATENSLRLAHGEVTELMRAGCEIPTERRGRLVTGRNGLA
jgi:hypothetical protein